MLILRLLYSSVEFDENHNRMHGRLTASLGYCIMMLTESGPVRRCTVSFEGMRFAYERYLFYGVGPQITDTIDRTQGCSDPVMTSKTIFHARLLAAGNLVSVRIVHPTSKAETIFPRSCVGAHLYHCDCASTKRGRLHYLFASCLLFKRLE
jgi:hypothetical protein